MTTKMKGLLKGLRYISQIFDNEKEQEMEIGYPTDVKHVAHIGWDGPSVNSPSWMNEFRSTPEFSSAPLSTPGEAKENPAVEWVSTDSSRRGAQTQNSPTRELPKSSRRQSSSGASISADSPTREVSDKPRQSRRHQSTSASNNSAARDLLDSTKPARQLLDSSLGSQSPSQNLPNIPKKSRRKKSKDTSVGGSTRSSRSKAHASLTYTSPFSDPGSGSGSVSILKNNELSQTSTLTNEF